MAIKFSILNARIRKQLSSPKLTPYTAAKHIGLVITDPIYSSQSECIEQFTKQLRNDGKTTELIIVYSKKKPEIESESGNHFKEKSIDKKDLSLTGLPKSENLNKILAEPYDFLIFCNPRKDLKHICIAGLSKSLCKIGPSTFSRKHLNLVINCKETNSDYYNSIYSTLNQIR